MALTDRQQAILDFLRQFIQENKYPPSIREIMTTLGISSTSVVNYNLNVLAREGYISRHKELARGIRLMDGNSLRSTLEELVRIPLLGRIVASEPAPVFDDAFDPSEYIELTRAIVKDDADVYALEVSGDSMIDALIHDGDIVVMKHQKVASNGDLVAVWLKDEKATTLKRFYHEGKRVRLQPANPYMDPIYTTPDNVEIQGKVIMVIRQVTSSKN